MSPRQEEIRRPAPPPQTAPLYTMLYMPATRTQIYLSNEQRRRLDALRRREGRSLAELVREAVDLLLDQQAAEERQTALQRSFGAAPHLSAPDRSEWDRGYG